MTKIIDTFLFFQELDLAEIRMEYLNDLVDHFVIVEAAQTFSGKPKPFNFEANKNRFARFSDKITYIKIEGQYNNHTAVVAYLGSKADNTSSKIRSFLEGHNHYSKDALSWVLESFHRECIHYALSQIAQDNDVIMLSDLDEIPSRKRLSELKMAPPHHFVSMRQHEFCYFLNFFKDSDWIGPIAAPYSLFKDRSLNELRRAATNALPPFSAPPLEDGGWHFTSIGDIETIRKKIESWAHQELNTGYTMSELEKNIRSGQDIFNRRTGTLLTQVDIATTVMFDDELRAILLRYAGMISTAPIETVRYSRSRDLVRRARKLSTRLGYELKKRLGDC